MMSSTSRPSNLGANPIVTNRQLTDKFSIPIFLTVFVIWLLTSSIALDSTEGTESIDRLSGLLHEYFIYLTMFIRENYRYILLTFEQEFLAFALVSLAASWLWLRLMKLCTMFFIYAGMLMHVICTFAWGHHVKVSFYPDILYREKEIIAALIVILLRITSMVAGIISLSKIGTHLPGKIIGKIFRPYSIILIPRLLILYAGILTTQNVVFQFMIQSMWTEMYADNSIYSKLFVLSIIVFGGFIVLDFCFKFSLMVISYEATNFYWTVGHRPFEIERNIDVLQSNHLGTMMFSSMRPVSWICALIQAHKHIPSWQREESYSLYIISKIFLTMSMPINALIFSAIYGTDFVKSTQLAFDTVLRRCYLYLATTFIIEGILSLGCVMSYLLQIILVEYADEITEAAKESDEIYSHEDHDDYSVSLKSFDNAAAPYSDGYLSLIYICARVVLFNQIISLNEQR